MFPQKEIEDGDARFIDSTRPSGLSSLGAESLCLPCKARCDTQALYAGPNKPVHMRGAGRCGTLVTSIVSLSD